MLYFEWFTESDERLLEALFSIEEEEELFQLMDKGRNISAGQLNKNQCCHFAHVF